MTRLPGKAILASAGSGKTFQLAHHYIRLLAEGEDVPNICALTFSRKAAGEILESISEFLWKAASKEDSRAMTAAEIGRPAMTMEEFCALLRTFADSMHRASIGTLDSFILGILRAFPMELGIPFDFQVTEGASGAALAQRRKVLDAIFHPAVTDEQARRHFHNAFKQVTFGREEKGMERLLHEMIQDWHDRWRHRPDEKGWGNPSRIWGDGFQLPDPLPLKVTRELAGVFIQALQDRYSSARFLDPLISLARFAGEFTPRSQWDSSIFTTKVPREALSRFGEYGGGLPFSFSYHGEQQLDEEVSEALHRLVGNMLLIELHRSVQETQGLFRVLEAYDEAFLREIGNSGILSFSDAQHLLGGDVFTEFIQQGGSQYVGYRLDCMLNHLLLDEFQDTNDLQWDCLKDLSDDILMDEERPRSFLVVGDIKQAIHGWRGGNVDIIRGILRDYAEGGRRGHRLQTMELSRSERSGPQILEAVNQAFTDLPESLLLPESVKRWYEPGVWMPHACSPRTEDRNGCAVLLEAPGTGGKKVVPEDNYWQVTAAVINQVEPTRRGLEAAVLVGTNKQADKLVTYLREACPGIPIMHEGRSVLKDSLVVKLVRSLLRFAAHPGDMLAWRHIQMSPLFGVYGLDDGRKDAFHRRLMDQVYRDGFTGFVNQWSAAIEEAAAGEDCFDALTDWEKGRLDLLVSMARQADASGSVDVDAFIEGMDRWEPREGAGKSCIRVMTIHQSKGLGFDLVILPALTGESFLEEPGQHEPIHGVRKGKDWMLMAPRKDVWKADEVLSGASREIAIDNMFEHLCNLYVAMTRPKFGLYMIVGEDKKNPCFGTLLKHQLKGTHEELSVGGLALNARFRRGELSWFESRPIKDVKVQLEPEKRGIHFGDAQRVVPERAEPSQVGETSTSLHFVFDRDATGYRDAGTAAHDLFEQVAWIEDADVDEIISVWERRHPVTSAAERRGVNEFREALGKPDVSAALSAAGRGRVDLWREKAFEVLLPEGWISGKFDRVEIERDEKGNAVAARILDYKTGKVDSPEKLAEKTEGYRPQMELYRRSLSAMLGLSENRIKLMLIFTGPGCGVEV